MAGPRKGIIVKGRTGDPESVYDTFTYLNTANASQKLFQNFSGRSLDLTNMTDSGKLPTGKSLIVRKFNVYLWMPTIINNATLILLNEFLAKTTVEFVKENRSPSFTKTLQMIFGFTSLVVHVPTVAGDQVSKPEPFFRGKMTIDTSALNLGANQTFYVQQTTNCELVAGLNDLAIKYELDGLMSKKITE